MSDTPAPQPISAKPSMADRVAARRESFKPGPPPALDREEMAPAPRSLRDLDAEIEAELEAAMAGMSEAELYAAPAQKDRKAAGPKGPQSGRIVAIHNADVFIEVPGGKSQGYMPITQFADEPPKVGDMVEFTIERYDPANGVLVLTKQGAAVTANWSSVEIGQVVEAHVTASNKGGLSVTINGIRGFLPISQIDLYRVENVEQFVNQKLLCMVAEVHPAEKNLVVSRRALLEREREENAEKLWAELNEGQVRKGIVRGLKPFGAFVDLGGVDGLIPISEMSWGRIKDPGEVLQPGQAVEVYVARLDREKRKVGLSLRHLLASPWEQIAGNYLPKSLARGKVTRTTEFGAFVELEPGVEGLIHVSELAPQRVFNVGAIVKVGQEVEVMVLSVDPDKQRMSLSLKQAQKAKEPPPAAPVTEAEPEIDEPAKVRKPRTTPLRGGTGPAGPLFPDLKSN